MNRPVTYTYTDIERTNLTRLVDYSSIQAIPEIWPLAAQRFGTVLALKDSHSKPEVSLTYTELNQQIQQFAAGLQTLGVGAGDRVALFADNSPRWFIADQGTMTAGAIDAVRSSQAEREELAFILADSGSTTLIAEDLATLEKLRPRLVDLPIGQVVLLSDEISPTEDAFKVVNFTQLLDLGAGHTPKGVNQTREMLATLIYTSGTTGKPKGVMLSHGNLISQILTLGTIVQPQAGAHVLSILPTWHSYERTCEYFLLSQGCTQYYTNIRYVKRDLREVRPNFMVAVPRLWESIYEGIQKQFREQPEGKQKLVNFFLEISQKYIIARRTARNLNLLKQHPSWLDRLLAGVQMVVLAPVHALADRMVYHKVREATGSQIRQVISGGGALAPHLDLFFEIVGVEILVGYGLTETSPVTNARRPWRNLRGSAGQPLPGTEIKIVDLETRQPLPQGQRGLVLIRGPQIMQGYYQNPEATAKAIDPEGWFDSGDLGWVTPENDLVLTGRAKDTIVLTNGENIEPQPIEDACLRSVYVDQIMLVGQDQKSLGALIVPNLETLKQWAEKQPGFTELVAAIEAQSSDLEEKLNAGAVQTLYRQELNREVQNRPGYRVDDRIGPFRLLAIPFSMENGMLTQTLKIRRPVVMERYRGMIDGMFAD
ncbi:long-chain fatty acid--CoA ligase [Leptolyngbya sp. 'hensonii']|uniref:AMP-dependent synthetase/ligase n=1 Tax=Leptolyngbya sp. 'hensonii' TaxID=1922337 RepID=UPI00094F5E5C|nr:AMP-binding protein [Leptolyngbya sp. 'hensonii']OLP19617.1 long-chain fatty acid--CoA ligase [Leptolyngbya sp. 'hensonii']